MCCTPNISTTGVRQLIGLLDSDLPEECNPSHQRCPTSGLSACRRGYVSSSSRLVMYSKSTMPFRCVSQTFSQKKRASGWSTEVLEPSGETGVQLPNKLSNPGVCLLLDVRTTYPLELNSQPSVSGDCSASVDRLYLFQGDIAACA